jgi:flavin reductase (DIM6/NTAB) family NADH-FMN oxidoreductase RutF
MGAGHFAAQPIDAIAASAVAGTEYVTDRDPYRPLKNAFGRFATGVAVAACANPRGEFTAITVNSFTSVSLEPPLVLWCIEKKATSFLDFAAAPAYSISVLTADQQEVSERFARHIPDPLSMEECEIWRTGAPILRERLAGFDCEIVGRHQAGDHIILVARVVAFDALPGAPLQYFASRYWAGPLAPELEGPE